MWTASDAGDERLAYAIRREAGSYRLRDADLNDVGAFADLGAALREGNRMAHAIGDHL